MADVDGSHIAALLLRLFVMYFPQLIEAGMVYKALPPLYSIKEGKKTKFFIEQIDIVKFIQKDFLAKNTFLDMKKKALDNKSLTKFFLKNADYIYYLTKVANTYAVDSNLLEVVLYNYIENNHKMDAKKLAKVIKSLDRFMNVETSKSGYVVLKGSIAESNLIICHDKFFNDCRDIIKIIESNDSLYYLVNNKPTTLYHIMLLYEKSTPSSVQRYKGLGEMQYYDLRDSTLSIADRSLIRYTMDDAKEAISIVREYESDSKKILQHTGIVTRDDLLD